MYRANPEHRETMRDMNLVTALIQNVQTAATRDMVETSIITLSFLTDPFDSDRDFITEFVSNEGYETL
jgi:hypothetical protein